MYSQTHLFKQFNCRKKTNEFYCTTLWNALEMNVLAVHQGFASLKIISQPHPDGLTPIYIAPTRGRFCISRWSSRLGPPASPDATVASGSSGSKDTCLDRSWVTAAGKKKSFDISLRETVSIKRLAGKMAKGQYQVRPPRRFQCMD